MSHHGFVRIAAASPRVRVADCDFNAEHTIALLQEAEAQSVHVIVFPELGLTGYTCGDLFHQAQLQRAALEALERVAGATTKDFAGLAVVGLPMVVDNQLFNCAAVLHRGQVLGLVPKSYLPNYKEYYERRWFAPAINGRNGLIGLSARLADAHVPFGTDMLFEAVNIPGLVIGIEICEDLWAPIPPSSFQALAGATVLLNLSASNDLVGKAEYRKQLVVNQSARCIAAYAYSSCGVGESTTDVVFGGHHLVAENGTLLAESQRFQRTDVLTVTDVDLDRLRMDRLRMNSFGDSKAEPGLRREFRLCQIAPIRSSAPMPQLLREVDAHPFVPRASAQLRERCEEIFHIQVAGLAKRLEHIGKPPVAIGVSGGLDSTLALLVACKTMDSLEAPRERIKAITMPGFGTTSRTLSNARALMKELGVTAAEVDIRGLCLEEMRLLGHRPFGIDLAGLAVADFSLRLQKLAPGGQDLVFENVQARMRTNILMNAGFVIGTGDVSELALGWCTYNGDQMNMYNPNVSIPKTLVKFLIQWVAEHEFSGEARRVLLDVVATVISPELLPADAGGKILQQTESVIGPYELVDFFLFHFLRYGAPPAKILYLASHATFHGTYSEAELRHWLTVFLRRFFANQFKRSCMPDGPKVGSISLSPRGDWRMPSDAQAAAWLAELEPR